MTYFYSKHDGIYTKVYIILPCKPLNGSSYFNTQIYMKCKLEKIKHSITFFNKQY